MCFPLGKISGNPRLSARGSKMAALVEGQQYGLSSHDSNSLNKTLIFVKLTDSALKSIEEYVQKQTNSILKPSIQFQSNNGVIRLPITEDRSKSYGFTLSNVETDGPQGSFECLHQSRSRSLDSLGCMVYKMHISANEESYETTKFKMAAVEKENKKFCTKEIKPSGSHVGRKVKVKRPVSSIPSRPSSPPLMAQTKVAPKVHQNLSSTSTSDSNAASSFTTSICSTSIPSMSSNTAGLSSNSTTASERHIPAARVTKNPELLKMSCRDRIIHLLALRSYKKPELLAKLLSEGIKEKEKRGISAILSQVAVCKGNSYTLANHAWNEVQDAWKYYTREEAETVCMRKQEVHQNAQENGHTTPSSSPDQSSPQKRALEESEPSYLDQRSKKQRISHYRRDISATHSDSGRPAKSDVDVSLSVDSKRISNGKTDSRTNESRTNGIGLVVQENLNQKCTANSNHMPHRTNGIDYDSSNKKLSPNQIPQTYLKASMQNGHTKREAQHQPGQGQKNIVHYDEVKKPHNLVHNREIRSNGQPHFNGKYGSSESDSNNNNYNHTNGQAPVFQISEAAPRLVNSVQASERAQGWVNSPHRSQERLTEWDNSPERGIEPLEWEDMTAEPLQNSTSPIEFTSEKPVQNGHYNDDMGGSVIRVTGITDSKMSPNSDHGSQDSFDSIDFEEFMIPSEPPNPDYLREFVKVTTQDQRDNYKAAFNAQYDEYKVLYDKVFKIVKKFIILEQKLNRCKFGTPEHFAVKGEIYSEYKSRCNDKIFEDEKNKLAYLHAKLSHIKRLVTAFDARASVKMES